MPGLNVSSALTNPLLADRFIVWRRNETVDAYGISELNSLRLWPIIGVITQDTDTRLERTADFTRQQGGILIVTKFALRGASAGYQPDVIEYDGNHYIVDDIQPYTRFGPGFIQAKAVIMEFVNSAPETSQNG